MATQTLVASGIQWTDRRNWYISPNDYAKLYPSVTPFLSDLFAMWKNKDGVAPDETYKFFEYRAGWRYQYLDVNGAASWSGAGTPGDTITITVDGAVGIGSNNNTVDASIIGREFEVWDTTKTTYRGNILVTAVNSATEVVAKCISNPASATEAIANLSDNDRLWLVGGAFGRGSEAPEAAGDELETVWNSIFYHRTALELDSSIINAALRGTSDELGRMQTEKANEHKIQLARKMYLSARRGGLGGVAHGAGGGTDSFADTHVTDANSKVVPNTMGLIPAFRRYGRSSGQYQNVWTFSKRGATYNDFVDMAEKVTQYANAGGRQRCYAGPGVITWLNKIGAEGLVTKTQQARIQIKFQDAGKTTLGHKVSVLNIGGMEVEFVQEEVFRNTPYHDWGHLIDLTQVGVVFYPFSLAQTGETTNGNAYVTNIKRDNNPMLRKDEYVSAMGLKLCLMERHHQLRFEN